MVTNVTSLTGNGLKDWLVQRVSAVFLLAYIVFLFTFVLTHPALDYTQWSNLFHCRWVQVASVIALISILLHAWIGIWTVTTDYIKQTGLRLIIQFCVATGLLVELVWGAVIIWGQ